ncbi:MAG: NmrA/HSCARG family protein [Nitrospirota bacterium]|nr:MAG: NmrA/HSCARG family protein [Nitrospirota bacterium]
MESKQQKFFVVGATGQQGGAVTQSLIRQGHQVRALVRKAKQHSEKAEALKKLGVEIVLGDMTNQSSLEQAMSGVDGVFSMTTFFEEGLDVEVQQGIILAEAAQKTNVPHLVYSSVGSAHRNTGIPHFESKWKVEQHIQQLGVPATILRPTFFMDNFANLMREGILQGNLTVPMRPEIRLQMVAVKDIGEFGAAALVRPKEFIGQGIELAGDELTMGEVAANFSSILQRPVHFTSLPDDQAEAAMGSDMAAMFRWFNEVGYCADIQELETRFGIPLTSFGEYLETVSWVKS